MIRTLGWNQRRSQPHNAKTTQEVRFWAYYFFVFLFSRLATTWSLRHFVRFGYWREFSTSWTKIKKQYDKRQQQRNKIKETNQVYHHNSREWQRWSAAKPPSNRASRRAVIIVTCCVCVRVRGARVWYSTIILSGRTLSLYCYYLYIFMCWLAVFHCIASRRLWLSCVNRAACHCRRRRRQSFRFQGISHIDCHKNCVLKRNIDDIDDHWASVCNSRTQ